jgi:hypothetical protein
MFKFSDKYDYVNQQEMFACPIILSQVTKSFKNQMAYYVLPNNLSIHDLWTRVLILECMRIHQLISLSKISLGFYFSCLIIALKRVNIKKKKMLTQHKS